MLRDITFGQYVHANSPVHRLDPRLKLVFTILYIVLLFSAHSFAALFVAAILGAGAFWVAQIPSKLILRSIRPIMPIVLFTAVLNMFFVEGPPLFTIWKISVSTEGIFYALFFSIRVICLIAGSSLLTYTTTPIALTDAMERLFQPLKRLKFPVHELAMIMSIALRFIPLLLEETDRIMSAQKSRGSSLDTGPFLQRIKALIPILVPLFISSFRRSEELALAMECRCYKGGEGRTRLHNLKMERVDLWAILVFSAAAAVVLAANHFFEAVI